MRIRRDHPLTIVIFCLAATYLLAGPNAALSDDWPMWRGPHREGVAASEQDPPQRWSENENVLWRTAIPGRGHGSVTVSGDRVYLATAESDRKTQSVIALDRGTGRQIWQTTVHQGEFAVNEQWKLNEKATWASSTVATDGQRLFINFLHHGAVYTTALDLDGRVQWQQKLSEYVVHQGYGASPTLYQDLVIATADNKGGGAVVAMDRATGEIVWRRSRPEKPNYASPVILRAAGSEQLILTGCDLVTSLDPLTGRTRWEIEGATTECVTTSVTDGEHVYTSGGYPKNHVSAVRADGSGEVVWEENLRNYVPSMLEHEGYLYLTLDDGIATCLDAKTGKTMWKGRLGGNFSSSPVLVGDTIYATNEDGTTYLFRADPEQFELLSKNQLGDQVFATPTICDGRIYTRVAVRSGDQRQEFVYCLGKD